MISLTTLIKLLIGLCIILLIIWSRFIRIPMAVNLDYLKNSANIYFILFDLFLISTFYFIFIISLRKCLKIDNNIKSVWQYFITQKYVVTLQKIVNEYIITTPIFVYEKATEYFSLKKWIELPASYLVAYFNYPRFIVIIFSISLRLIVAITFMIEIIYVNQVKYFLLVINLMMPFIIYKVIIYVLLQYSQRLLKYLELHIVVTSNDEYDLIYDMKEPLDIPTDQGALSYSELITHYNKMCDLHIIYTQIKDFASEVKFFENLSNPYVTLITSACYFCVWSYILISIIFKFIN